MKKIWFPVFCIVMLFAVSSCEKSEDELIPDNMEVKIFMSSDAGDGLKSAQRTEVSNGDTVDVENLNDINLVFAAEDAAGFNVSGTWTVSFVENDITLNDPSLALLGNHKVTAESSMLATKLPRIGLYKATFHNPNILGVTFYVRYIGVPGIVGDIMMKSYAFRLERDLFQFENDTKVGYTVYIKFWESDKAKVVNQVENFNPDLLQACVNSANYLFNPGYGVIYAAKNVKLSKCVYADTYLTATFFEDDIKPHDDMFFMVFYYGTYGNNWTILPSVSLSDWRMPHTNGIAFKVM